MKPCPFCGGTVFHEWWSEAYECYMVECQDCGAMMRGFLPEEARAKWNERCEVESSEDTPVPIGACSKCGSPQYTSEGFCGACRGVSV